MQISGIAIAVPESEMGSCLENLRALDGVEVHHAFPEHGKIVVVQETETREQQEAGLRRIQALPGVLTAELVYHYLDEEARRGRS